MVGANIKDTKQFTNFCAVCEVSLASKNELKLHKISSEHRGKWLKHWYQNNRLLLAQNKSGVEVRPEEGGPCSGVAYDERTGTLNLTISPGLEKSVNLVIKNTGGEAVMLRQVEAFHSCPSVRLSDAYNVTQGSRFVRILSGVEYGVEVKGIAPDTLGVEQVPVAFQFSPDSAEELFFIVRTIVVSVVDQVAEDAGASSPFRNHRPPQPLRYDQHFIPGVPLSGNRKGVPLKQYKYSTDLKNIATKNFSERKVAPEYKAEAHNLRNMLNDGLQKQNYRTWYSTMLWMEEMQMELDIRRYSLEEVCLKAVPSKIFSNPPVVEIKVEGLAEKRPSVLKGDNVYVCQYGRRRPVYAGVVHMIKDTSLYLAFDKRFMDTFVDNLKVNVEFEFNRHPMKVSHRALEMCGTRLTHLTFPTLPLPHPSDTPLSIVAYNRKLEQNPEQIQAVRNIVSGTSLPAPYIVFGPPGTGKTVTIVEAIKQVIKLQPQSRVLVCASSNAAADLVADRLLEHIITSHILRLYAISRDLLTIPSVLKNIANLDHDGIYLPEYNKLKEYRVIVSTLVTASWIVSSGVKEGHLTHVFLDECGQSTEPEALVALAGLANHKTQVVLAGDPHQLGPVIRNTQIFSENKLFSPNGLDKSFLERLMEQEMYQPQEERYNTLVVTKLVNNYRSHVDILNQPNAMFYNSHLRNCADIVLVESLCRWEHLPKQNFPLIFHSVKGKDEREGNSPSFFNALEVSKVVDYVKKLLDTRSPKIRDVEIGVITPYRRQVEKIQRQLKKVHRADGVKVGSPEEFQGDERRVIIISTVRASADHLAHDQTFRLGFLRNPKRFNVAVTRAKALLIIVGCPDILVLDKHWGGLLEYIQAKGGYTGPKISQIDYSLDDIVSRFDNLGISEAVEEEISARELIEAPEWRGDF
ncbi:hypothetical protein Pcinc_000785 [Petrolisthes cinctipes]|uniref:RNA helicase n=1 Tax=Petrolisthes cinctipes TaxID=88211 RepID=A0AAE1GPH0_PETCI|nr:hypothetical protein Pcinc_000785 [Petrolisthes cinctipes]